MINEPASRKLYTAHLLSTQPLCIISGSEGQLLFWQAYTMSEHRTAYLCLPVTPICQPEIMTQDRVLTLEFHIPSSFCPRAVTSLERATAWIAHGRQVQLCHQQEHLPSPNIVSGLFCCSCSSCFYVALGT
jgi:hypothetical protein